MKVEITRKDSSGPPISISISTENADEVVAVLDAALKFSFPSSVDEPVDELATLFHALKINSPVDELTGAKDTECVKIEEHDQSSVCPRCGHQNAPPEGARTPEVKAPSSPPKRRCNGYTLEGKQCQNLIEVISPSKNLHPHSDADQFCSQHTDKICKSTVKYIHSEHRVELSEFIPIYLQDDTKAALIAEMQRKPIPGEKSGFIYAYEIIDASKDKVTFKVGMTEYPVETQLGEWSRQCGSKEVTLCGIWPDGDTSTNEENEEDTKDTNVDKEGYVKSRDDIEGYVSSTVGQNELNNKDSSNEDRKPGSDIENGVDKKELINFSRARDSPGGAEFCRKLERLIHIELADLVVNTPYLSENFPNASTQGSLISSPKLETPKSGRRSSGSLSTFYQELQECVDCGTFHREEFSFIRLTEGPYKGEGREKLVKPVIERWRKYIETVYKIEQSDKLAQHTLSYWDVFLEEMHDINAGTSYVCLLFMAIFYFWACVVV